MNENSCCENVTFPIQTWPAFYMATAPTIPSFYWDVVSDEQRIKEICCRLGSLIDYLDTITDGTNELADEVAQLKELFEQFQESGFDDYYEQQVKEWIAANLAFVFESTAKQVFFGINKEGYFTAYVPQSWDQIIFDTGAVYADDTYGRLILRWDVLTDNTETVDQTPETIEEKPHGALERN